MPHFLEYIFLNVKFSRGFSFSILYCSFLKLCCKTMSFLMYFIKPKNKKVLHTETENYRENLYIALKIIYLVRQKLNMHIDIYVF